LEYSEEPLCSLEQIENAKACMAAEQGHTQGAMRLIVMYQINQVCYKQCTKKASI
jgi:hypothetical protein